MPPGGLRSGFSLIELLTVVALMGLTFGLLVPATSGLLGSQRITRATNDLSFLLEYARTEAMTRQTYVWVCFGERKNASGNDELSVVVLASRDGTPDIAPANLRQLSRRLVFENVVLSETASLRPATRDIVAGLSPDGVVAKTDSPIDFNSGGVAYGHLLTFSPRGDSTLEASPNRMSGFAGIIDISMRQTRGGNPPVAEADDAAVYLYGASGRVQVARP